MDVFKIFKSEVRTSKRKMFLPAFFSLLICAKYHFYRDTNYLFAMRNNSINFALIDQKHSLKMKLLPEYHVRVLHTRKRAKTEKGALYTG